MKPIQLIYPLLKQPRKCTIVMHQKPDADAMGASLALNHFLVLTGHSVNVICPTNWAGWLDWMPGVNDVVDYESGKSAADKLLDQTEWLFCLDFNALHRTRQMEGKLQSLTCTKILVDHHREPQEEIFEYGVSNTAKSSTCEMIYDIIVDSGNKDKINIEIAECIYAGIIGDTGSFRFPSTHGGVHSLVAALKEIGLEHSRIHDLLFDNFLENRLRFVGHVLLHRMEVFYEYNTVLIAVPKSDVLKYHIKTGDTEGLVNYPQAIQGIKLVALCIDRDEERKWSFRSKGDFDCNSFARKYFEGGGHFAAAGGRSSASLDETVKKFKQVVKENQELLQ